MTNRYHLITLWKCSGGIHVTPSPAAPLCQMPNLKVTKLHQKVWCFRLTLQVSCHVLSYKGDKDNTGTKGDKGDIGAHDDQVLVYRSRTITKDVL